MAKNRNNNLTNRHKIICGQSGSGKTTFVTQCQALKKAKRVLYWDPYHDHKCTKRFDNIKDFTRFLSGAIGRGVGFKCALSVDAPPHEMCKLLEKFYDIAWLIADGTKDTYLIVEEIADGYDTIAKAKDRGGQVFRAGRSFGLIIYALTQSVSEVPKTVVKQCGTKVVFRHDDNNDMKRAADLAGHRTGDISGLQVGEYYIKSSGMINGELKRTRKL
jgi:energy-coupling factor transporter ATP-binding protein EcfA2